MTKNKIKYKVTLIIAILFLSASIPLFALNSSVQNVEDANLKSSSGSSQYIDSIGYFYGSSGPGSLSNTHVDDGSYKQINSEDIILAHAINVNFNFNPALAGRDFLLSLHVTSSRSDAKVGLYVNGDQYGDRQTDLVLTNIPFTNVNSIALWGVTPQGVLINFNFKIDYFELEEIVDSTPYETNEEHAIGGLPGDDWDWYFSPDPGSIQVVQAADHQVDMNGKVIKLSCEERWGTGYTSVGRSRPVTFGEGDSLLLSFKSQINKDLVPVLGFFEVIYGTPADYLLKIYHRTWLGNDDLRIEIEIADGRTFYYHTMVFQTTDIDIFMFREPSNIVKYFICINDVLLYDAEVTMGVVENLYTAFELQKLQQANGLTEDFFLDDFYLGSGSSYEIDAVHTDTTIVHPMYYLFKPEFLGSGYIVDASLMYQYIRVDQETVTFTISPGVEIEYYGIGVGASIEIPLIDIVDETSEYKFIAQTAGDDVIVYLRINAKAKGVTLTFPGAGPLKEIIGLAEFIFGNQPDDIKIESAAKSAYGGPFPDEWTNYKQDALSGSSKLIVFDSGTYGGTKTDSLFVYEKVKRVEYSFGISVGIPGLDLGLSFSTSNELETEVWLSATWHSSTPGGESAYFEAFIGTGSDYLTTLNLPPIHGNQFTPINLNLQATGGQGQISLLWSNVPHDYYNIYRNNVKIATSTSNSYIDTGLADSATYTYYITVTYLGQESDPSIPDSATTLPPPVTPATPGIYLMMILSFGVIGIFINRKSKKRKRD